MPDSQSRRDFLKKTALSVGFLGLQAHLAAKAPHASRGPAVLPESEALGYGPLVDDPKGLLRLPKGFRYTSFSARGEKMDDGFYVPGLHDGMATFEGPNGQTILVRNHEMDPDAGDRGPFRNDPNLHAKAMAAGMFDQGYGSPRCTGGTTTLLFDTKTQTLIQHSLSLSGTLRNCSGGPTPWGTWITCEETVVKKDRNFEQDHGYCFEVPATTEMKVFPAEPIRGMGRYNHEAIAVDPTSGIVYLTEDRSDGLLYRYIPNTPGKMLDGGKLQALAIKGHPSRDTRNWKGQKDLFPIDEQLEVEWIDMEDVEAPEDDLRYRGFEAGAARFARGEGMAESDGAIFFACTNGGRKQYGQIFKYVPSADEGTPQESGNPGHLELFIESHSSQLLKSSDNLTVAPWGDIVICEDDSRSSAIVGVTPSGKLYQIGHVAIASELAGACFSPDGTTLFVNVQNHPGQTLAITGPWAERQG